MRSIDLRCHSTHSSAMRAQARQRMRAPPTSNLAPLAKKRSPHRGRGRQTAPSHRSKIPMLRNANHASPCLPILPTGPFDMPGIDVVLTQCAPPYSPSATWPSSAENTPVHQAVAQFSTQPAFDSDESLSDTRRATILAAARRDPGAASSAGSGTASPRQHSGIRQATKRPNLALVTPAATGDAEDVFSFHGSTSNTSLLNASASVTSFNPPSGDWNSSTPPRRDLTVSTSEELPAEEAVKTPLVEEALSSPSNAGVLSPGKRSPQHINTSASPTPLRGMSQQRISTASARSSSVTPTPTPTRSRPGTREGRGRSPASPLSAGPSPSTASSQAWAPSSNFPPSREVYAAQEPAALARDSDASRFLASSSSQDFAGISASSSMVSYSSSRRDTPMKRPPPSDMTFGDPAMSPVRSVAESMRVAPMLPIEILRGHERKESSSSSGSGTRTPTPSRPSTRGTMTIDTRPRSRPQTPSPTKLKYSLLGDDLPHAMLYTSQTARPPSPARSVDTVGTVDDVDFIVAPNMSADAMHAEYNEEEEDLLERYNPVSSNETWQTRRPVTADPTCTPTTPSPRPRTPTKNYSRPNTARERESPPMFRTTSQGVPTSVSLDSPPLSESGGSPSFNTSMSFGSSMVVIEPLNEAARRRVDEGEVHGLGIGPGELKSVRMTTTS
ncbi:hypothetical protein EXIGLDRAFT_144638 [Exidia glandulosa HHB12029]|uniref:Uncharacterized protein n=1 Tax=Exidia glandulosa HHB12029 TaxID=1314781 RepID=A0A165NCI7_EXIGL|nr:hypothetical protein EXIGLDRAFT_144638 [Exidia glandulosa HHB12029]